MSELDVFAAIILALIVLAVFAALGTLCGLLWRVACMQFAQFRKQEAP